MEVISLSALRIAAIVVQQDEAGSISKIRIAAIAAPQDEAGLTRHFHFSGDDYVACHPACRHREYLDWRVF